jgi:hypothetical protein
LEQFWNKLLSLSDFSLYCAYAIDIFGKDFQMGSVDALLCAHSHLMPCETAGRLEAAIYRALDEVFGSEAQEIRRLMKPNYRPTWAVMPTGEAMALWIRNNLPGQADTILSRARELYHAEPCIQ